MSSPTSSPGRHDAPDLGAELGVVLHVPAEDVADADVHQVEVVGQQLAWVPLPLPWTPMMTYLRIAPPLHTQAPALAGKGSGVVTEDPLGGAGGLLAALHLDGAVDGPLHGVDPGVLDRAELAASLILDPTGTGAGNRTLFSP